MTLRTITLCALAAFSFACDSGETAPETVEAAETAAAVVDAAPSAVVATPKLNIGDTAPDFALTGTDGGTYSLDGMKDENQGFIVTFTCNTCPYAVKYEDRIIQLHQEMAAKGFPVVAIQPNDVAIKPGDNMEAMQQRVADKEIPYLYLLDAEQSVYPAYGATRTPEIFLLDKGRTLLYHGAIDDDYEGEDVSVSYVKSAIDAHLSGKEIDPVDVKAVGCTIKAK
ncbi:thioredoxin family protein [Lewinellaceae bacterium SD302]|nr:thioredoxin family protein [Lewinellaceae bacterium SD302]